jgi:glyoxylase-like metal-dependent hydrolase (beta-lactamase superfamily II)
MKVHTALGDYLAAHSDKLAGVMLTHAHLDHVAGMPDVPHGTPIYAGPGECTGTSLLNFAVRGPTDRALDGQGPVSEWAFQPDPDGRFDGVIDVFGDGSLWALYVPGHTPGSTAYVARTKTGPVLLTGDVSHTAWGWANGVGPGSFSADQARGRVSLARLRRLAAEHPAMQLRLGHQPVEGMTTPGSTPPTVVTPH